VVGVYLASHAVAPENMSFAEAPPAPVQDVVIAKPLLKFVAPWNMKLKFATAFTFQELMSWLNAVAPLNMSLMSTTADVSQPELNVGMGLLNVVASWNMPLMFLTFPVFHELMSWLNNAAPMNMSLMSVTPDTSHGPMLPSNVAAFRNKPSMLMPALKVQDPIALPWPSLHVAPVASPPRQYEDAMVFTRSAFEANGDAYVHAVSTPGATSPWRRYKPVAHAVHTLLET
jgi:hypothetical protein